MKNSIVLNAITIENLKIYIFHKALVLSIICDKCGSNDENKIKNCDIKNSWFNS